MTTALEIIEGAARLIGATRKGEALDADEAADGLVSLNDMLSSWSNHSLNVYARTLESLTLATSALSYTIGSGATLNTTRPVKIVSGAIRSGSIDYDVEFVSETEFESIGLKSTAGGPSYWATYDNGYPTGTLRFFPMPTAGDVLRLLSEKPLTEFASLSTTVDLPPGTRRALRFNLALEMAPEFGKDPSPVVVKGAMESLGTIRLAAAKSRPMPYLPGDMRTGNIYNGYQ